MNPKLIRRIIEIFNSQNANDILKFRMQNINEIRDTEALPSEYDLGKKRMQHTW